MIISIDIHIYLYSSIPLDYMDLKVAHTDSTTVGTFLNARSCHRTKTIWISSTNRPGGPKEKSDRFSKDILISSRTPRNSGFFLDVFCVSFVFRDLGSVLGFIYLVFFCSNIFAMEFLNDIFW